jgi:hypothetical protein
MQQERRRSCGPRVERPATLRRRRHSEGRLDRSRSRRADMRGLLVFIIVLLLGGGLWAALVSGCVAS